MGAARGFQLVGVVGLIIGLYFLVPVDTDLERGAVIRAGLALVVLVALAVAMTRQLRLAARDGDRRVDGLVAAIVLVLVVFAFANYTLQVHDPDQLRGLTTRLDALYFSATTMLTIGYGDVHAVGQLARALALVQMAFDVVFVASAAALLTSRVRRVAGRAAAGAPSSSEQRDPR